MSEKLTIEEKVSLGIVTAFWFYTLLLSTFAMASEGVSLEQIAKNISKLYFKGQIAKVGYFYGSSPPNTFWISTRGDGFYPTPLPFFEIGDFNFYHYLEPYFVYEEGIFKPNPNTFYFRIRYHGPAVYNQQQAPIPQTNSSMKELLKDHIGLTSDMNQDTIDLPGNPEINLE